MKLFTTIFCLLITGQFFAQKTSINFELNNRPSNQKIQDSTSLSKNPFAVFVGEWTLKEDTWIQNWGYGTDTIKILHHHTVSSQINTDNSLLSIIDGPEPNGHIFWSYNPNTKEVAHLSSFGTIRAGKGSGTIDEKGNLVLKLQFEGEPSDTYRMYSYKWLSPNEYEMVSTQYDKKHQPTGLFYRGIFTRFKPLKSIKEEIEEILNILDNNKITKEEQIGIYADDIIHMAPNHVAITNKKDLLAYLNEQKAYGYSAMEHQIVEFSQHADIILMRGRVVGNFHPSNGGEPVAFQTKNMFVFKRIAGELKISKVIYNISPID